jgi:hypothetical protein
MTFLPDSEPEASATSAAIAGALAALVETGRRRVLLVAKVDGEDPSRSPLAPFLREAGFLAGSRGFLKRTPLAEARQPDLSGRKSLVDKDVAVGGTLLVTEPR